MNAGTTAEAGGMHAHEYIMSSQVWKSHMYYMYEAVICTSLPQHIAMAMRS